jgi:hypothetical protein
VVIADENGPESIGGIMGGEHSGCDENTTNVLIESALWDPINIAKTGRSHGIITDARYRFERGVDPEYMVPGLERTTELVLEMCGGTAAQARVTGYKGHEKKVVDFPFAEVRRLTGLTVSNDESSRDPHRPRLRGVRVRRDRQGRRSLLASRCRWQGRSRGRGHAHPWCGQDPPEPLPHGQRQ